MRYGQLFADRILKRVAARRRRAEATDGATGGWCFAAEAVALRALASEAVGIDEAGLAALDAFEAKMTDLIEASLAEHLDVPAAAAGVALSQATFGSKAYVNRLDRQLAVGASAVALTLAEESGIAVVSEALRQGFLRDREVTPAWPPGSYVLGSAADAADAVEEAVSLGDRKRPPVPTPDRPRGARRHVGSPTLAVGGDGAVRRPPEARSPPDGS